MGRHTLADALLNLDTAAVERANLLTCQQAAARRVTVVTAVWLAPVEVVLMLLLAVAGRRGAAARMLAAVGVVYAICEIAGAIWPRERPFARVSAITPLVPHAEGRSFPSRHVASGLAMAAIGGRSHPRLGATMASVAWALGVSRVAAGLHYPSDVLAGAFLGVGVARTLRG